MKLILSSLVSVLLSSLIWPASASATTENFLITPNCSTIFPQGTYISLENVRKYGTGGGNVQELYGDIVNPQSINTKFGTMIISGLFHGFLTGQGEIFCAMRVNLSQPFKLNLKWPDETAPFSMVVPSGLLEIQEQGFQFNVNPMNPVSVPLKDGNTALLSNVYGWDRGIMIDQIGQNMRIVGSLAKSIASHIGDNLFTLATKQVLIQSGRIVEGILSQEALFASALGEMYIASDQSLKFDQDGPLFRTIFQYPLKLSRPSTLTGADGKNYLWKHSIYLNEKRPYLVVGGDLVSPIVTDILDYQFQANAVKFNYRQQDGYLNLGNPVYNNLGFDRPIDIKLRYTTFDQTGRPTKHTFDTIFYKMLTLNTDKDEFVTILKYDKNFRIEPHGQGYHSWGKTPEAKVASELGYCLVTLSMKNSFLGYIWDDAALKGYGDDGASSAVKSCAKSPDEVLKITRQESW